MAHSLLEKEWIFTQNRSYDVNDFLTQAMGLNVSNYSVYFNYRPNESGVGFFAVVKSGGVGGGETALSLTDKNNAEYNKLINSTIAGSAFYHISMGETVKYFKHVSNGNLDSSYTYLLAQDITGEWVVFNGDKMYSNYGTTGIYNNFHNGAHFKIVDGGNMFMISEAYRFDTGVKFKELYFVLSAKSYSDTNCIIEYKGKKYRLVSVSNVKDEAGRYPAFAFPVSD